MPPLASHEPKAIKLKRNALPSTAYNTLKREKDFRHPPRDGPAFPEAHRLIRPHIESFNALFQDNLGGPSLLELALADLDEKVVFDGKGQGTSRGNKLTIKMETLHVGKPLQSTRANATDDRVFPSEARERLCTYGARMTAKLSWTVNDGPKHFETRELGHLPIMVGSSRCHLKDLSPIELVQHHEEAEEMGGYFIVNGIEKLIRYLIVPRRNHAIALKRGAFMKRGDGYTEYGVQIRCTRPDQSSQTNALHYLSNGSVTLRFSWRKNEYLVPVMMILKALGAYTDKDIFAGLVQNDFENTFLTDRIELLLRSFKNYNLYTGEQCLEYLGDKFRVVLGCPDDYTDKQVGEYLLRRIVLVHLPNNADKFRMLLFMMKKLYALIGEQCCADNPDSPQHQEVLMPGFLMGTIIKERLEEFLNGLRLQLLMDQRRGVSGIDFHDNKYLNKSFARVSASVGGKLTTFLASGNLVSPTGLDLQQTSGFTIVAEKLNFYRFLAHFRSVHRGSFFMELRTTTVRKLLPDSWGFLCPVHTPDGGPCGLLNHFSHTCELITDRLDSSAVPSFLSSLGMLEAFDLLVDGKTSVTVQLDGRIIGWATPALAEMMAKALRTAKTEGKHGIPLDLEIGLVPSSHGGQFPGLYLFSTRARMMRPVKYLKNRKIDHIGSFEQIYLDIACRPEEVVQTGVFSHVEIAPTHMLSVLANLTPFSDYNQSPRNMYQCQMGKQTMGTPTTNLPRRTDGKLYRIQSPQTPIVRPALHDTYGFDAFPNGTNAVVAVISYTGYDMEDAMILNKSAHERGFGYGSVYKSAVYDLKDMKEAPDDACFMLGPDVRQDDPRRKIVDDDGFPAVSAQVKPGDAYAAWFNPVTGRTVWLKYKGDETAYVEEVRIIGNDNGDAPAQKVHMKLRIPRAPVIGDKFSSRHGQKGVCSQKWPAIDMPFSESGMMPDVIINPHAFPSRMTIGMFVESLAGKAGALHGLAQDATPFCFDEKDTPSDFFGKQLLAAGYNYHGNEPMYSGITGQEFKADIYLGLVYYQRLRHMVNDKFQVRTEGPIDQLTHQPIKGRKKGGGVRFGEMERDALLAHGTSFLLQDRLLNCSDWSTAWVCRDCGSMISLGYDEVERGQQVFGVGVGQEIDPSLDSGPAGEYCRLCRAADEAGRKKVPEGQVLSLAKQVEVLQRKGRMALIVIPFVFRYLLAELAAMGVKLSITVD